MILKLESLKDLMNRKKDHMQIVVTRQTHGIWNITQAFDNIASEP